MDRTARDLLQLLRSPDSNLRLAAMRVVTALEMRQKSVLDALGDSLDSEQEALKVQALHAMAQLGPAAALEQVAPMLLEAGAVRQHAARVVALGGAASLPALRRLYAKADHHGKRAIASTMTDIGGVAAFDFLLRALPAEDLELAKHLTQCARAVLAGLPPEGRRAAMRALRRYLKEPKTRKNPHALVGGLVLLGGVTEPKAADEARRLLFEFMAPKIPEPARRNAAISLARLPAPARGADALLAKIAPFLCEKEWSPAPQNLLPLLQKLEFTPATASKLLPLLRKTPHDAIRIHLLERLRGCDKPDVVREVLPYLQAEHPRLREAAESALKTMPCAMDALFALLLARPGADTSNRVQWILRAYPEATRKKYAKTAAVKAVDLHEKGDGGAQIFLDFSIGADPAVVQKHVASRIAVAKRSSARDRWTRLASLYALLDERNLLDEKQRYDYGLTLLRKSAKNVQKESRAADPALQVLQRLARQDGAALVRALAAEKGLGAEDYYYLGFHLSEAREDMREHGARLLAHLASRYPRHKLGRAAKQKLVLLERQGTAAGS